jgi:hypothetical protein
VAGLVAHGPAAQNQLICCTVCYPCAGRTMDLWLQILFGIILIGTAIELAYIGKAIGETNKRLSALLKHIKP